MACQDCSAARETAGLWRMFDPRCLYCGGRLLQRIGKLPIMHSHIAQRRKVVLADWVAMGHAEQELRDLAGSKEMAAEPITKEASDAPRRQRVATCRRG